MTFFRSLLTQNGTALDRFLVGLSAIAGYFLGAVVGILLHFAFPIELLGLSIFMLIAPFAGVIFGLWLGSCLFLKRPFLAFFSPLNSNSNAPFRFWFFAGGMIFWLTILVCVDLVFFVLHLAFPQFGSYSFSLANISILLHLLPFFVPFFGIQTLAEELLFRGWLNQFLGSFARIPLWFTFVLSSSLFALIHGANPESVTYGFGYFALLFLLGILLSFLSHLTNGIEVAWGVHFINNMYTFSIVSYPSAALATPSLFQISQSFVLPTAFASVLAAFAVLFFFYVAKNPLNRRMGSDYKA